MGAVLAGERARREHRSTRARGRQAALDSGRFGSSLELARAEGIGHPRIALLLDLLTLPPEIQAALDVRFEDLPTGITQADVRALARMGDAEAQRAVFSALWTRRTGSGRGAA